MSPEETLRILSSVIQDSPQCDDTFLFDEMVKRGCLEQSANEAIQLTPIAFGRAMLHGLGIQFSNVFLVFSGEGVLMKQGILDNHLLFQASHLLLSPPPTKELFQALALRSSEVRAVNELLLKRSKPENLRLAPVALFSAPAQEGAIEKASAYLRNQLPEVKPPPKSRWKFW